MSELVFLLEEPSAQAMLEGLLPRLLTDTCFVRYVVFEGKQDLDKNIVRRLRGYLVPNAKFVILRDKDSSDCGELKRELIAKCQESGRESCLVRIACHELESWYLADLAAVEVGLEIPRLSSKQKRARLRNPDNVSNAAEELTKLTNSKYQKIAGSRAIGPHLELNNQRSRSFSVFVSGIKRLADLK